MNNNEFSTHMLPDLDEVVGKTLAEQIEGQKKGNTLAGKNAIALMMGDEEEIIPVSAELRCLLGRFEDKKPREQAVDLSSYGALEYGVSRIHAQLHNDYGHLYVTDLGSSNGTYIGSTRLIAHAPAEMHDGDELRLGKLRLKIEYR